MKASLRNNENLLKNKSEHS